MATIRNTADIKHTAHIVAFKSFKKSGGVFAQPLDTTPFDEDAFVIPGENAVAFTDEEFEALMSAHDELQDVAETLPAVAIEQPALTGSFLERMAAVDAETKHRMVWDIANRLDDRIARAVDEAPVKIKNLERARSKMVTGQVALALAAAGRHDAEFINRSVMAGSEFNVYGLFKLPDLINGLAGGTITNAINIAIVRSMFALERAGISFDFETAKSAASIEHPVSRMGVRQHLTRHTVAKGTASTQAGSTMHALKALGVVDFVQAKNPTYVILQNATTDALRAAQMKQEVEA